MSGAPVLLSLENKLAVVGIVLGIDIVEYGGVEQRVGIAMIGDEILALDSEKLGGRILKELGFDVATYGPAPP
jgi:hypothetical protein